MESKISVLTKISILVFVKSFLLEKKYIKFCLYSLIWITTFPAWAQQASESEFFWFDGHRKRSLLLVENELADVSSKKLEDSNEKIKTLPRDFKVKKVVKGATWTKIHLESKNFREQIKLGLDPTFSPVFLDAGVKKILAGGIIVKFKKMKTAEEVVAWAQIKGLEVDSRIGSQANKTWLIRSAPGLPSLELANTLREDVNVSQIQPNWSREYSSRAILKGR